METLPAGCDIPPGRTDRIVSGITGRPLAYFTPDPLPELLDRLLPSSPLALPAPEGIDTAFLLARPAAQRNPGDINISLATSFCEILSGSRHLATTDDILKIGAILSPRAARLRQEIVFSGGPTASFSEHIFTPPTQLPGQIEALTETMRLLRENPTSLDPTLLAACVGFYSVHTHPFLDANGRWSRLQSAYAAKLVGNPLAGMISATMQSTARDRLANEIWPTTRRSGFRELFIFAIRYHTNLAARISPALSIATRINNELTKSISNKRALAGAMTELYVTGRIESSRLRAITGLSLKATSGITGRIANSIGQSSQTASNAIEIHELHEHIVKVSNECAAE